ncbi:hypothetical protein JXQ70_06855, partial [bacterium]|nr:hypothetical protein [bacterium]
ISPSSQTRTHILDIVTDNPRDARRLHDFMDNHLIKTRHDDQEVRQFFDQTTYDTWQKEESGYRSNINRFSRKKRGLCQDQGCCFLSTVQCLQWKAVQRSDL